MPTKTAPHWLRRFVRPATNMMPPRSSRRAKRSLLIESLENRRVLATLTVNATDDVVDAASCTSTHCSLREAINDANSTTAKDQIQFAIPGAGVQTIRPTSRLPWITRPVEIDATNRQQANGGPGIVIDGTAMADTPDSTEAGLLFNTDDASVLGLAIVNVPGFGIWLYEASSIEIDQTYVGVMPDGVTRAANSRSGILLQDSSDNQIGSLGTTNGNVISGNTETGIYVFGNSDRNVIVNNLIGTDASGQNRLSNSNSGVLLNVDGNDGPSQNRIEDNIISGNARHGVLLVGEATVQNQIKSNQIGLGANTSINVGNDLNGIYIGEGASDNIVGGRNLADGNLISQNAITGIIIADEGSSGNEVLNNTIGLDQNGIAKGNGRHGVLIDRGPDENRIGRPGQGNVIAANGFQVQDGAGSGVFVYGTTSTNNTVQGNHIGVAASGVARGNAGHGIVLQGGQLQGNPPTIMFVIDVSGSTEGGESGAQFPGTPIGDFNNDGHANEVLDAELQGASEFLETLDDLGLGGTVQVGLVAFGSRGVAVDMEPNTPGVQLTTSLGSDNNSNGRLDVSEVLQTIQGGHNGAGSGTNFGNALEKAIESFDTLGTRPGDGNIVFLTDGESSGSFDSEITDLEAKDINRFAVGVDQSSNTILSQLRKVDAAAKVVSSTDELSNHLLSVLGLPSNTTSSSNATTTVTNTLIGGPNAGDGNIIAHNQHDGILVFDPLTTGNTISRNSIHSNAESGIDLNASGIQVNDPRDIDGGANQSQNYPLIQSASRTGNNVAVVATIDSTPGERLTVEVFGNRSADTAFNGEGEFYLGTFTITLNNLGGGTINGSVPITRSDIQYISMTATDSTGNTSEFSPSKSIQAAASFPEVSIAATTASVTEDGTQNLVYRFERTGATTSNLTIDFTVTGNASLSDYTVSGETTYTSNAGSITIPAGQAFANLILNPTTDSIVEPNEQVLLTLFASGNSSYVVSSSQNSASGTITNDDVADTQRPTANMAAITTITTPGGASQQITVTYADNVSINTSSIDGNDLEVQGPTGTLFPRLVSVTSNSDGTPIVATYQLDVPGGTWDAADNGNYNVAMRAINEVLDTSGNSVPNAVLDSFQVNIGVQAPEVSVTGNGKNILNNDLTPSTGDGTNFTSTTLNAASITRVFTVTNQGNLALNTSGLSATNGFVITEGLDATIQPGGSDTFTVSLQTDSAGTKTGEVSFNNNDSDENPFRFAVTGLIVDSNRPTQNIFGSSVSAAAGQPFRVNVQYDTSDNNTTLSGLGVRMHFDSSKIQFDDLSNVFASGLIQQNTPEPDTDDFDNDASTDRFVLIAWADVAPPQEWPNQPLPVGLFDANFTLSTSMSEGDTSLIRFSASSVAATHDFNASSINVSVAPPTNLDVDANGVEDALTDGLLVLRHLFGFQGQSLVDGALGINPPAGRTDPTEITQYLNDGMDSMLDVDGNGVADALTDGILILRYLFGFSGDSLTQDALSITPPATRTDPVDVVAFLDGYRLTSRTSPNANQTSKITVTNGELPAASGESLDDASDDGSFQVVASTQSTMTSEPGETITVPVLYDTSDDNNMLPGLGLRMHFDSSRLQFNGLANVLSNELIQQNPPALDTNDEDNDPATDQFILVAWADIIPPQAWPDVELPATLFEGQFTTASDLSIGTVTQINFTASSTAPTHTLQSTPVEIRIAEEEQSTLSITATDAIRTEGEPDDDRGFTFTITREGSTNQSTTVDYEVTGNGDSPANATDFGDAFPTGTVTLIAGQTEAIITVAIQGDQQPESDEGFAVTLSNPTENTQFEQSIAFGTILDDDQPERPAKLIEPNVVDGSQTIPAGSVPTAMVFRASDRIEITIEADSSLAAHETIRILDADLRVIGTFLDGVARATVEPGTVVAIVYPKSDVKRSYSFGTNDWLDSLDAPPMRNVLLPTDANGDGRTSAVDALNVIDFINQDDSPNAARSDTLQDTLLPDVDDSGHVSAVDALMIINRLNSQDAETPTGEDPASFEVRSHDLGPIASMQHDDDLDGLLLTDVAQSQSKMIGKPEASTQTSHSRPSTFDLALATTTDHLNEVEASDRLDTAILSKHFINSNDR